ncbi:MULTISPECIES: ATP-binding protein [unclassified Candidatus Frackibacter]|uniref:ATP-binding protein n=1 Tax=unclassified Candidatus Frackibacter TaxID=2648818 RepID=UPI00079817C0|nr:MULTISPECIES: P-loop NTPase [unclassified Candidatus Frackibacter]KXS44579.1 MAG: CO dehydrogenase maturation factor [Candidatus Frackibacter sp. T328-2]SDC37717.1 CO dehydrogenase maturation factor [Candidatus Frackibacter sp. WG11]SEM62447.1 CO dehydrogenase maturation factor [Candidatus Frackibacter sp. WG12]SFL65386.1 CO dehydrogenase maturation factor [Candidatus Frackibacter sp. WG13]
MKIAISGKGGVGKTTVTANLSRLFAQNDYQVFAVDADPDANLATALGIPEEDAKELKPLVELEDIIEGKNSGGGSFVSLTPTVDDVLDDYSYKLGNIKFVRMGAAKQGGSECYCKENSFLRSLIESLLIDKKEVVILDMGAGIEHLSRGTAKDVDCLIVIVEPSQVSIETADKVKKMAADLGIPIFKVIANKVYDEEAKDFIVNYFHAEDILGFIPFSQEVITSAMDRKQQDKISQALRPSMKDIYNNLLREAGDK